MSSAGFLMDKINILGVNVDVINQPELLAEIDRLAAVRRPALVNNVNVHACNIACKDQKFRDILNASEIVFCDGFGVKLGARMAGKTLGQRMTPPDWIDELFKLCVCRRYCIYFIGDTDHVVQRFAHQVKEKYPALRVVGWHDGFFEVDGDAGIRIMNEIQRLGPDVILTGMGMPLQEKWAWQAKARLGKGVIIATGALFRWYTGYEKRAPDWVTQSGFEWLARLVSAPRRHFKRYVVGLPLFFLRIVRQRLRGVSS
jgi:N-acetylglucosaminyldiphosphoundecaprenol N-acetyl-beta-D-mannosaminyltransferase